MKEGTNTNRYGTAIDTIEILLEDDRSIFLRMQGMSMYPTLKTGDIGQVKKCVPDDLKIGDIVVMRAGNIFVAHRLIGCSKNKTGWTMTTRGDNNRHDDNPVTEKELVGKLVSCERNGRIYTSESGKMKCAQLKMKYLRQTTLSANRVVTASQKFFPYISSQYKSIKNNINSLVRGNEKQYRTNAAIAVLKGLAPLGMIVSVKFLIDFITRGNIHTTEDRILLFVLIGITALLFLAGGVLNQLSDYLSEKMSQSVTRNVYEQLHRKHIGLQLSEFENTDKLDKMHRAVQEASYRPVRILQSAIGVIKTIGTGVVLLGLFIWVRWYLVFILLVAVAPEAIVRLIHSRKLYRMKETQVAAEREKHYYNRVLTGYPFAKELRLFGFERYFLNRFNRKQDELFLGKLKLTRENTTRVILAQAFGVLLIFSSLGIVAYLTASRMMTVGTVVLFFFAFQRGYGVLNEFFRSVTNLVEDNTYLNDLLSFLNSKKEATLPPADGRHFSLQNEIRFENVDFRYENSRRNVLNRINIHIPAGKTIALVGENGSGKTTLIKLLCGFHQPSSGKIWIDTQDAGTIGQKQLLANITAVFQDFALYQVSALDNILLGNISAPPRTENAKEAARIAGIDDAITHFPHGYQTRLGHLFRESEELSLGQWQRMALARAFYRNAPILLMDEPSSALDANSERQMVANLKELSKGKTTLIVSHRLSTVRWADYIYLLEKGEIKESGTHDELMTRQGKYFAMFNKSRE